MNTQKSFSKVLYELWSEVEEGKKDSDITQNLMRAFLKLGSETPDNLNCVENLEFGKIKEEDDYGFDTWSIKVKDKDISLPDFLNTLESIPFPHHLKEDYPNLEEREWDALMRMTTMIVFSFTPTFRRKSKSSTDEADC